MIRLVAVAALASLMAVPASAGGSAVVKTKEGNLWGPAKAVIMKGDKVVWKNTDFQEHNVRAYGGGWTKDTFFSQGESTSKRFMKPGTYKYYCMLHTPEPPDSSGCDGMCGTVVVKKPQ